MSEWVEYWFRMFVLRIAEAYLARIELKTCVSTSPEEMPDAPRGALKRVLTPPPGALVTAVDLSAALRSFHRAFHTLMI